jgi:4-amino-4-deoxy-L-arabinose transferase-like glycosyltransferase
MRVLGVRLGLPYFHHWDEGWIVDNTRSILQTPDLKPSSYQYGAPMSLLCAGIFRVIQWAQPKLLLDPADQILGRWLARGVTVVISASGAAAVYIAARHAILGDDRGRVRGVWAAILYATAAELVSHGRYGVTDANLAALVAWSLACAAVFLQTGSLGWATGTLLFAGLATSFKLTALPALGIPALAFALRPPLPPRRLLGVALDRLLLMAVVPVGVAIFLLLNTHVASNWREALNDITARVNQTVTGGVSPNLVRKPGWDHLSTVLAAFGLYGFHHWEAASLLAATGGAVGLAIGMRERSRFCAVAAIHAVVALLSVTMTSRSYLFRNYLVSLPALCIGFGIFAERLGALARTWVPERGRLVTRICLAAAFAIVYLAVPFAQAVETQRLSKDARIRAVDWIARQPHDHSPVTVAANHQIVGDGEGLNDKVRSALAHQGIRFLADVESATDAAASHADYVVCVSHATADFGHVWNFSEVPGYGEVARFEANPYEHNREITPTWAGFYDTVVLRRGADASRNDPGAVRAQAPPQRP